MYQNDTECIENINYEEPLKFNFRLQLNNQNILMRKRVSSMDHFRRK